MNFKFTDIANILNSVFNMNAENGTAVLPDLSNIVDIGKKVSDNGFTLATTGDALVNKIRQQILLTTDFVHTGVDCYHDGEDWAGITEVYRVGVGDLSTSHMFDAVTDSTSHDTYWTNTNTFDDLFGKEMPTIHAKYFEKAFTYRKKITIAPTQFSNAFLSPATMSQFINEIGRKVEEQWMFYKECLEYFALSVGVGSTLTDRNVKQSENITSNRSVILRKWTNPKEIYVTIKTLMREMQAYNNTYSANDYVSSVTDDNLVCYINAEIYDTLIAGVENFSMNGDVVKTLIGMFKPLPMFGYKPKKDTIAYKDGETIVAVNNIDFIICDKRLFGCTADHRKITSQYVANEDVTNYFHMATAKYRVNTDLPLVVCCNCATLNDVFDTSSLS